MAIQDGRYSLIYQSGDYRTMRVKTPTKGNLIGKRILQIKEGKDFNAIAFLTDEGQVRFWKRFRSANPVERLVRIQKAVDRITADPEGTGLAYAMKENRCCRCGKQLTVPASIYKGMGPECARKNWTREDQKKVYRAQALGRIQEQDMPLDPGKRKFREEEPILML